MRLPKNTHKGNTIKWNLYEAIKNARLEFLISDDVVDSARTKMNLKNYLEVWVLPRLIAAYKLPLPIWAKSVFFSEEEKELLPKLVPDNPFRKQL